MHNFSNVSINSNTFIKSIILAVLTSVATITILLCIVTTLLLFSSLIPYEFLEYIMLIVDSISVMFGAYIGAKINKSNGMIIGVINGAIVFIALIIGGFCVKSGDVTILTLLKAIVLLLCSSVGGIIGVNSKEKIHIR